MYGVELTYFPDKKKLERWNEIARSFEEYMNSLTFDEIEELLRKAVPEAYPQFSRDKVEACVAHEMDRVKAKAGDGGFSAYITGEDTKLKMRLLVHMPSERWLPKLGRPTGVSVCADGTDVGHQTPE